MITFIGRARPLAILLLAAFAGCIDTAEPGPPTYVIHVAMPEVRMIDAPALDTLRRSPARLFDHILGGDTLTLVVETTGDCARHDFALYGVRLDTAGSPPTGALYLSHDAHGDTCGQQKLRPARFGLGPIRALYRSGGAPFVRLLFHTPSDTGFVLARLVDLPLK